MHPVARRILLRSLFVVVTLGVIGYGYARVMLFALQANAPDRPQHQELLWRIPLTLAGAGLFVTILTELGMAWFQARRKVASRPVTLVIPPVVPPVVPPVPPVS